MRSTVARLRAVYLTTLLASGAGVVTGCVPLDAAGRPEQPQQTQTYPPCQYGTCTPTPTRTAVSAKSTVKLKG